VNPGGLKKNYQFLEKEQTAIEPPVWLGLIATFIRNRGYSLTILDDNAEGREPAETARIISELNPLLTGELCRQIKSLSPDFKVLFVGGHVAALPERSLQEEGPDFVCGGEGPYTLAALLEELKKEKTCDYTKVPGLYYRENEEMTGNPPASLVSDLDRNMAGVAWDLLPMERYRAHTWHCYGGYERTPYAAIYTSLGCPFHCSFCCIQAPFRQGETLSLKKRKAKSYRMWSAESIIRQIDQLVREYGVKNIKFADEMFVYNRSHVESICQAIHERGYDLNIWAYARVDTVSSDLLSLLKKAGVRWLCFGIEAADTRVRNGVKKGTRNAHIIGTLKKVREAGIYVGANYIFGLPDDDMESMQKTLDLAMEINAEFSNFYCAMAYPGSELYQIAIENNWSLPADWSGYSQLSENTLPLPTRHVASSQVLQFRDRAFRRFSLSENHLTMIEKTFGQIAAKTIRDSASQRLVRKNI
jgi:radical SAM superfamily enzyme YgiQ (UPF0313 family)